MYFLMDFMILTAYVFIVCKSYNLGIVSIFIKAFSYVIAIVAVYIASELLAQVLYDVFFRQRVIDVLSDAFGKSNSASDLFENIPKLLASIMNQAGITDTSISKIGSLTATSLENIISPMIVVFIRLSILPLLFFLILFIIKPLAKAVNKIFHMPVIGFFNRTLGLIVAIPVSWMLLSMGCGFIAAIAPFFEISRSIFNDFTVNNTIIFKYIYFNNVADSVYNYLSTLTILGG